MSEDEKVKIAKMEEQLEGLKGDALWLKNQAINSAKITTDLQVSRDMMKEQFVRHSTEHKNNYKDLQVEITAFKASFSAFKGDVLAALDKAAGRDGVIKLIAMPLVTAVIVLIVNHFAG